MSSLKTLYDEVELLVQFPEVGLAISDSTSPIPGYLYGEINAITYTNYGNNCKPLVKFLISRLQANTPLISIKILKLLLYLAKNGHTEIIEEIKYHEVSLKEAMGFYGPPDDLHGKTFYENIRKLSKELLDYIFSENKDLSERTVSPTAPELTSFGSNSSASGLTGFGYSVKTQKSVKDKISDGVTNLVEKLLPTNEKEPLENEPSHLKAALPQYKPLIINKDLSHEDLAESISLSSTASQKTTPVHRTKMKQSVYKPGKPGGGWDDSEDEEEEESLELAKEEESKSSSVSFDCIEFNKLEVKDNIVDWVDEHKIVDSFTINESLNEIEYTTVSALCKRCCSLNCDKILMFLLEKLEVKEELVQLRALILIEYLIFHDTISLESLTKILISPLSNLTEKAEDVPDSVKIKAKKVCLIIQNLSKTSLPPVSHLNQTSIKCSS